MTATERLRRVGLLILGVRTAPFVASGSASWIVAAGASDGNANAEEIWVGGVMGAGAVLGNAGRGIEGGGLNALTCVGSAGNSGKTLALTSSGVIGGDGEAVSLVEEASHDVRLSVEDDPD